MNDVHVCYSFDDTSDYRLFELDSKTDALVRGIVKEGTTTTNTAGTRQPSMYLTTHHDASTSNSSAAAFFCISPSTTLAVRKVEYSNSLFVSHDVECDSSVRKRERTTTTDDSTIDDAVPPPPQRRQMWEERVSRMFECAPSRSHVADVLPLLAQNYLTLGELENEHNDAVDDEKDDNNSSATQKTRSSFYTVLDLLRVVPCTFAQLTAFLKAQGAVVHRHYVRLIHPWVVRDCVVHILLQLESDKSSTVATTVSDTPLTIRWQAIEAYFSPSMYPAILLGVVKSLFTDSVSTNGNSSSSDECRSLKLKQCVVAVTESILDTSSPDKETDLGDGYPQTKKNKIDGPWMLLNEFYAQLRAKLPMSLLCPAMLLQPSILPQTAESSSVSADDLRLGTCQMPSFLPLLRGTVVVRQQGQGIAAVSHIRWCAESSLPNRIPERVRSLFALTGDGVRWAAADLRPFVEPLLEPGVTFEASVSKVLKDHRTPGAPVSYSLLS